MVEKNQQEDIINLTIHDEPRTATIGFNALTGDTPLGFVELKLTEKNDIAYNAMVLAAGIGLERSANVGHQVHVRYDSGDRELDEITVHSYNLILLLKGIDKNNSISQEVIGT